METKNPELRHQYSDTLTNKKGDGLGHADSEGGVPEKQGEQGTGKVLLKTGKKGKGGRR